MTHDKYKTALDDLDEWDNRDLDPDSYLILHEVTLRSALQLAQEHEQLLRDVAMCADNNMIINQQLCDKIEQLRKERDELKINPDEIKKMLNFARNKYYDDEDAEKGANEYIAFELSKSINDLLAKKVSAENADKS